MTNPSPPPPPHNKDWSDAALRPADQAQNLPDPTTYTLFQVKSTLNAKKQLIPWLKEIEVSLIGLGIHAVVDNTLERPYRDDPKAVWWERTSRGVVMWMRPSISTDILHQMQTTGKPMTFADEFFKLLKETVHGVGAHASIEWFNEYHTIKLEDFGKPSEYVVRKVQSYIDIQDCGINMSPCEPLFTMVLALRPRFALIMNRILDRLTAMPNLQGDYWALSMTEFQKICSNLIHYLRTEDSARGNEYLPNR